METRRREWRSIAAFAGLEANDGRWIARAVGACLVWMHEFVTRARRARIDPRISFARNDLQGLQRATGELLSSAKGWLRQFGIAHGLNVHATFELHLSTPVRSFTASTALNTIVCCFSTIIAAARSAVSLACSCCHSIAASPPSTDDSVCLESRQKSTPEAPGSHYGTTGTST